MNSQVADGDARVKTLCWSVFWGYMMVNLLVVNVVARKGIVDVRNSVGVSYRCYVSMERLGSGYRVLHLTGVGTADVLSISNRS